MYRNWLHSRSSILLDNLRSNNERNAYGLRRYRLPTGHLASEVRLSRSKSDSTRRDRPEPAAIFWRRVRPHDAPDVPVAVEHVVIVVRPLAARSGFGGAFEGEHGTILAA